MKKYEPKLFKEISTICDVQSFLVWKLTNSFKTSWASADPFGMFDIKTKKWSKIIINALGITEDQLPIVSAPGKILGNITKEVSMVTGLSRNTIIVAGGGDGQAAGLGSNVMTSKTAYLNLGTAVVAGVFGKDRLTHKSFRTMTAVAEDGYYYECSLRGGTFSIDWFIKNILKIDALKQPEIYNILEKEGESVSAGSSGLLFLPYISGAMNPYWDMEARGAFIGLSSSHSRGHMYRSILEGIALEQLFALNSVEKAVGSNIKKLAAIGGGAKSEFWCQIIADVTGKSISLPVNQEASSLGAAISAAVGAGWYNSFKTAAREMSKIGKIIKPNRANHKKYIRIFSSYRKIYPQLQKITIED
jgi:xylulokinase